MEVGTCWGGTFSAHSAVTAPHGRLIAVDAFPRENAAVMTSRFRSLARATQNVTCVWQDSHSGAAAAEIATALNGESLDVLFLDGDRTLKGVSRDYEMYSPLVRPGGVIAFHDIARVSSGVPEFWRSLRGRYESVEFIDRAHPPHGLGIGVIVKG
jgi:predicted O-methyltransferase YrrM